MCHEKYDSNSSSKWVRKLCAYFSFWPYYPWSDGIILKAAPTENIRLPGDDEKKVPTWKIVLTIRTQIWKSILEQMRKRGLLLYKRLNGCFYADWWISHIYKLKDYFPPAKQTFSIFFYICRYLNHNLVSRLSLFGIHHILSMSELHLLIFWLINLVTVHAENRLYLPDSSPLPALAANYLGIGGMTTSLRAKW